MLKSSLQIAKIQMKKLLHQPRILFCLILLFIILDYFLAGMRDFCSETGYQVTMWGTLVLIINDPNCSCLLTMLFAFIICDLPGRDKAEPYIYQRCGTRAWIIGKIITVVLISLLYLMAITGCLLIVLNKHLTFHLVWDKILKTLARTNAAEGFDINLYVSSKIIGKYTVGSALILSYGLYFFLLLFLGWWALVLNLWSEKAVGNIVIVGLALLSRELGGLIMSYAFLKFSPCSWASLNAIGDGIVDIRPTIAYSISALSIGCVFALSILISAKKLVSKYICDSF